MRDRVLESIFPSLRVRSLNTKACSPSVRPRSKPLVHLQKCRVGTAHEPNLYGASFGWLDHLLTIIFSVLR